MLVRQSRNCCRTSNWWNFVVGLTLYSPNIQCTFSLINFRPLSHLYAWMVQTGVTTRWIQRWTTAWPVCLQLYAAIQYYAPANNLNFLEGFILHDACCVHPVTTGTTRRFSWSPAQHAVTARPTHATKNNINYMRKAVLYLRGTRIFSSSIRLDKIRGSPYLQPEQKETVKPNTLLHLVPGSWRCGAVSPCPIYVPGVLLRNWAD